MRYLVFDIETRGSFSRGRLNPEELELTVLGAYDSATDTYASYVKEELHEFWPSIERADLLIGFNSDTFDIPILNRYYPGDLTKLPSLDLLTEVQKALGKRIRLDALAQGTLGRGKSGDGLKAGVWWEEGKHDLVRSYCIEDVRITKEIYEHALAHGSLAYKDLREKREFVLDTSAWHAAPASVPLTHALPL